ncbi:hypothetical protein JYQ62_13945 [Nostoc sp. UHCC 0702]|nr:hypothetical protein JYQ62_13945 [Nostoc sp. UHCC 0702]
MVNPHTVTALTLPLMSKSQDAPRADSAFFYEEPALQRIAFTRKLPLIKTSLAAKEFCADLKNTANGVKS